MVSVALSSGLTGASLLHGYNRQHTTDTQKERLITTLKTNQGITGQKIQNSVLASLASLPVTAVFSYVRANQQGATFCRTAASVMPKGAKFPFTASYLIFSGIEGFTKDPYAPFLKNSPK